MLPIPFISGVFKWFRGHAVDDAISRLNHRYTASIIAFLTIMVSAKQFVGQPIQCWMPAQFKSSWEEFAESYCFIQNTYFVPITSEIPSQPWDRKQRELNYYQWVPIVLGIQALLFYLPSCFWSLLHDRTGMNLSTVVAAADEAKEKSGKDYRNAIDDLATLFERFTQTKAPLQIFGIGIGSSWKSYVSWTWVFTKALYVLNVVGQFVALNFFLGNSYYFWGIEFILNSIQGIEWKESGIFPRVTLCDFDTRALANIHSTTVECVLSINAFNEKLYLFLWFWFAGVLLFTTMSFFAELPTHFFAFLRRRIVRSWIIQEPIVPQGYLQFLSTDAFMMLRFVEAAAGPAVAGDLVQELLLRRTELHSDFVRSKIPQLFENNETPKAGEWKRIAEDATSARSLHTTLSVSTFKSTDERV